MILSDESPTVLPKTPPASHANAILTALAGIGNAIASVRKVDVQQHELIVAATPAGLVHAILNYDDEAGWNNVERVTLTIEVCVLYPWRRVRAIRVADVQVRRPSDWDDPKRYFTLAYGIDVEGAESITLPSGDESDTLVAAIRDYLPR
ncbi:MULTISPECIES: hypothetical protein [Gordonia]|uniref:Uncharacterized protein n=1 Tax=Gordonia sihwensis NBRC 108236 TaxID=1223544 RepID=L7LPH8_9ACTN|nr:MULTISPECIES: hypothetical protein [Gordonia]AUH69673.1 hypothetical protein CXX93_16800 [Gordonia sp. YC-JH1]GAC62656.1 hypothetical protein GSI01S_39_00540 [Gordonia sihwensis NBRC 108236]